MFTDTPFVRRRYSPRKYTRALTSLRHLFFHDRMADPSQEDFSQLPLPDRFAHKNWKVRKEGYEAAAKEFERTPDESDPAFRPFLQDPGLLKDAAGDSNVAAQQEGLTSLCAFLKYGGSQAASRTRGLTLEPIREKGLSSTRPAAKAAAIEAVLLYVEIDKPDFVLEELLPALSHKQPKVIAATLSTITAIFHNFGCKIVDYKPVLKCLPKVFGHADKNVRAEATNLTVELYRWLKEAMKVVFWNDLKPVQQQDLEKLFEKVKEEPPPKQERLTRAQQAAAAVAADTPASTGDDGGIEEAEAEEPAELDAFDLAEPVDVFPKIAKDLHENLASSKWKDRKDALDGLLGVLNTARIKDGPFDDIIRDLAKIILKDANVAVVTVAANCVEKLALGVRNGFAKYRSTIFSPMLERCKEKKQAVADALGAALDAVFASTSLSDCLEETLGFLTHKNPQVKLETVKFLTRCLRNTRDVPSKAEVKLIADAATKLLTESTEVMRSGGAEILGTLMKILGERPMGPYLDGLDDIRKAKIKEYFDTAIVKAKERPKPVAPPAKIAGTSAVGRKIAGPGVKKSAGVKKPAPIAIAPPPQEDEYAPMKPQSTARSLAKPGLSRPGSGLAAPSGSKLSALKKPTSSGAASPQRRVVSPPTTTDDEEPPAPSPAKFGLGRGGLAGRPLTKPAPQSQTSYTDSTPTPPISTGLSAIERAELEELRAEKLRLTSLTDSLRASNVKLSAEISELQNQNAQLIEDHTRDVLQIKAKETQLVRARGECDVLRSEVESAKKDIERQKREMGRLGRESFGRDVRDNRDMLLTSPQEEINGMIYSDANTNNNNNTSSAAINGTSARPGPMLSRTGSAASTATGKPSNHNSSRPQSHRDRFDLTSPSEEKENTADGSNPFPTSSRRKLSPSAYSTGDSGRASPQRSGTASTPSALNGMTSRTSSQAGTTDTGSRARSPGEQGQPAENWKRAAEVTSQLKARIEQMKVRSFLLPPHFVACVGYGERVHADMWEWQARQGLSRPQY
jgi:protein STU2